jgi:hypothetical protein
MTVLAASAGPAMAGGRAAGDAGQPGQISPDLWAALLDDAKARARVHEKVYRRGPGQCHYWLGALSSGGHGRLRLGVRTASAPHPAGIMVAPHVYLYQESRGLLRPLPDGRYPLIRHRCGEPSCLNPIHLAAGTAAGGAAGARGTPGPAADIRGAQGRAMAIRNAIMSAIAAGATPGEIEVAIEAAAAAGNPAVQTALPFPGEIELPPDHRRGAVEAAAAAASPVVIPAGQGELF